jgi:hypothetical protein
MFLLIFTEQTPPPVAVPHQDHRAMQLLSLGMKNRKPSSTPAHPSTLKSGIVAEVIVHQSQEQKLHEILNLRTLGNLDCERIVCIPRGLPGRKPSTFQSPRHFVLSLCIRMSQ